MSSLSLLQKLACKTLSYANVPKHIAFIMDGNRRYATKLGKKKTEGHQYGFQSMKKSLLICQAVGIEQVTLFAFAIQNFNRSKQEVDFLMQMVEEKFQQLSRKKGFFQQKQINVKVIGDRSQLSESVIKCFQFVQQTTKNYSKLKVNICFAYNSDYQIQKVIQQTKTTVSLSSFLDSLLISPPQIIVRTSNEIRLSNFLTIQALKSQIIFLQQSWPQINIFSFLRILIPYHINHQEFVEQRTLVQKQIDQIK